MRLGVRGKLFGISVGLVLVVVIASGVYMERFLRSWLRDRTYEELSRFAVATRTVLEELPAERFAQLQPTVDRLSTLNNFRVTVIARDGSVWADSTLTADHVASSGPLGDRPEVMGAWRDGEGVAWRYSTTLHSEMLYVAVPFYSGTQDGVVRIAMPLRDIEAATGRLRFAVFVAGVIGLLVAILMSGLASHFMAQAVRGLVARARQFAQGLGVNIRDDVDPPQDELNRLAGTFHQIAEELDRAVATLARDRDRFETILEGMTEGVLALDVAGRITLANRGLVNLLRLARPPVGKILLEAIRLPALADLITSTLEGGKPAHGEIEIADEPPRVLSVRAASLRATGGCVVVMRDTTELRRLESIRRDFVANVSHELRTPVSVIRANAETLLDDGARQSAQAPHFLNGILRNAERLTSLISDLLDLSRIESGKFQTPLNLLRVAGCCQRAVESVTPAASAKALTVRCDVDGSLSAMADERSLEQILVNFLDNAVKYTPEGGTIAVHAQAESNAVRIAVEDNGPGIAPKHRRRVFERFYRIDPGRSRALGGTGLGLAIVRHLAESMMGKVGLTPASPHGCIFWVELTAPTATASEAAREAPLPDGHLEATR